LGINAPQQGLPISRAGLPFAQRQPRVQIFQSLHLLISSIVLFGGTSSGERVLLHLSCSYEIPGLDQISGQSDRGLEGLRAGYATALIDQGRWGLYFAGRETLF